MVPIVSPKIHRIVRHKILKEKKYKKNDKKIIKLLKINFLLFFK